MSVDHQYLDRLFANGFPRANYLCHWSTVPKYVYVETPKVACTSVKLVLQRAEAAKNGGTVPDNVHDREASLVPRYSDDPALFQQTFEDPETFKFCFVRNPFSRSLSCYLDKFVNNDWERNRLAPILGLEGRTAPPFVEFLKAVEAQEENARDIHWSTQTFLLRPNRVAYDFIGRFETFGDHFSAVCRHLGLMKHYNEKPSNPTGAGQKVRSYFGPEEVALVRRIYDADFRNFGYGFGTTVM